MHDHALRVQFAQLSEEGRCPSGVYLNHKLHGVIFVHRGCYANAIIRFRIDPTDGSIRLVTPIFHPLVDLATGRFALPTSTSSLTSATLSDRLHALKAAFKRSGLESVRETDALNREAWRLYRNSPQVFHKLAQQSAKITLDEVHEVRFWGLERIPVRQGFAHATYSDHLPIIAHRMPGAARSTGMECRMTGGDGQSRRSHQPEAASPELN